jgi:phosphate starvation-inducible protein PhoH
MTIRKRIAGASLTLNNNIEPLTLNQERVFKFWNNRNNLILHGYAGTGKTFIALYLALKALEDKKLPYRTIVIIRSAVPSRDIGFLPGSAEEKAAVYEEPYETIVNNLYGRGDAYGILKKKDIIQFRTTSYMRGITYDKSILIVDEIQNMVDSELNTMLTRIGEDCRFMMLGDIHQTDLNEKREKSGLKDIFNILKRIDGVSFVEFNPDDIVRSDFVRNYILERERYLSEKRI